VPRLQGGLRQHASDLDPLEAAARDRRTGGVLMGDRRQAKNS
jgi:hypothetical protein